MSYKSENWKDKLEEVRNHIQLKEGSVEKTADEILESQIEESIANDFIEDEVEVIDEKIVGTGEAISKIFKTKDKKEIDGIANLMNMTSTKVLQAMQKQNPKGFKRMAAKMGELPAMEEVDLDLADMIERIDFHKKSPAEKKGSEFDRKSEIKGYKQIIKVVEKLNKDHEKFQYNNRAAQGPDKIFKGLQQVESACYDMIRQIDQGKWDGKVDLEEVKEKPVEESVERTTEKLVERNMLGRLAKQLQLNEEGKNKMFAYFEKGELQQ